MHEDLRISHNDLRQYLEGGRNAEVEKLRAADAGYGLLFSLLDRIRPEHITSTERQPAQVYSFSEIDDLLDGLVAGTLDVTQQEILVRNLYHSADFFRRVQVRLKQMSEAIADISEKEMQQVAIKSDEDLLAGMGVLKSSADKAHSLATEKKSVIDKIRSWVEGIFPLPRYAYVGAAIMLFVVSYFGIRFYNTTYQLMLAEDLLEENYRVYMRETPRLSGGYEPTGISTLLAEESDESSYLIDAENLVQKVISSDYENVEALHLKAKILFINNDLQKASDILKRLEKYDHRSAKIMNDLGVVNFNLGNFEQSIFYYDQALHINPEKSETYYNLALTYYRLGNNTKAIEILDKYLTKEKDEGWYNAASQFYNNLKKATE